MATHRGPGRMAREMLAGLRLALAGFGSWVRAPRLMVVGALPALITAVALTAGLVALGFSVERIGHGIARPLVGDGPLEPLLAATAAIAVLVAGGLVAVALFTSVTLLVGQPFFEAISRRIDADAGGLASPAPDEPWWPATLRGIREGSLTVAISIAVSLSLLVLGLVPVVGSGLAFATGALVGGRLLAIELTAYPLARRGIVTRRERMAVLRPYRARTVIFGAAVFVTFLLPLGAVVAMPAAVAGATLLARSVWDGAAGTTEVEASPATPTRAVTPPDEGSAPAPRGRA
ncbi:EI24 domain-containing protein [Demequina sp.]|uniref:EI24 domain-containing protein n=1 Tax=Demequina sp. TaxID=2050685 RepID=UPI0025E40420|nr:EI24 domain-containing protein [Demequina sp.]